MTILILTQTFPLNKFDSTAPFMLDFALGFAKLGHEVIVLTPFHPNIKPKSFKKIKVLTFKYIWPNFLHLLGYGQTLENDQRLKWFVYPLAPLYFLFAIIKLYKTVIKYNVEVVSAHWVLPNGFIAAIVSKLNSVPLFVTIPGSDAYLSNQNFLFKMLAKFTLLTAKKVISNSPLLLKDLGVKGDIISYPVPKSHEPRTISHKLTLATAGRPVEKKGFEILKQIVPSIEIITELPINQFRKKLLSVDIFIALSIRDSKGNLDDASLTVLEAMAAGCAVIASNLPGYQRIIKDHCNGLLVSLNPPEIFSALEKLIRSKKLRLKLGKAAQKTIKNKYTPETIAKKYLQVFIETTAI